MPFAPRLEQSLSLRERELPSEFAQGDGLGQILARYLLAVEAEAENFILTSILLVDGDKLRHGAAPHLPEAYCKEIDGLEYGPCAGSCGTAAYFARPIYVSDIANDPYWADYKHLALEHRLRACWSTPIFDDNHKILGTFAIYHLTTGAPSEEEIAAITTITAHVARAIMWSRGGQAALRQAAEEAPPRPN